MVDSPINLLFCHSKTTFLIFARNIRVKNTNKDDVLKTENVQGQGQLIYITPNKNKTQQNTIVNKIK